MLYQLMLIVVALLCKTHAQDRCGSGQLPMRDISEDELKEANTMTANGARGPRRMLEGHSELAKQIARRNLLADSLEECVCDWCELTCPIEEWRCRGRREWNCGQRIRDCGRSKDGNYICVCDLDKDKDKVCWQDDLCLNRMPCSDPNDCAPDEDCVSTCCDNADPNKFRCFKKCEVPNVPAPTPCPSVCEDVSRNWECGANLDPFNCGEGDDELWQGYKPVCVCDRDIDNNKFCWQDNWCALLTTCSMNSQCMDGYACIPDTCCGVPKCIKECDNPMAPA